MRTTEIKKEVVKRIGIKEEWSTILLQGMKKYCGDWIKETVEIDIDIQFTYVSHSNAELYFEGSFRYDGNEVSHFILLENSLPVMAAYDEDDNIIYYNID